MALCVCLFVCLFVSFVIEYGPCFIFVEKISSKNTQFRRFPNFLSQFNDILNKCRKSFFLSCIHLWSWKM